MLLYSVKLKDCFMHHLMWRAHRVVLIVPITPAKTDINTRSRSGGGGEGSSSGAAVAVPTEKTTPTSERKRRRKPKIETLQEAEEELDDIIENNCSPNTSCADIRFPCFSMYELRHKQFCHMTNNAVYAYTYKHQIKSLRTPSHWVQVLRRMGGVQVHGYTCRLINIKYVKDMCQHFNMASSVPSNLEALCRNDFPKTRILIDLSQYSPDQLLEADRLDIIPACPFNETSSEVFAEPPPVSRKTRKYQKRKQQPAQEEGEEESGVRKKRPYKKKSKSHKKSYDGDDPVVQQPPGAENSSYADFLDESHDHEMEDEDWMEEEEEEEGGDIALKPPPAKRVPPSLASSISSSEKYLRVKKKRCPKCDSPIARKCKKCPCCGKRFGVFTFGRKLCPSCGRINLARMANCFQCAHPMMNAEKAVPNLYAAVPEKHGYRKGQMTSQNMDGVVERLGSMFGARRKRTYPTFSGGGGAGTESGAHGMGYMQHKGATGKTKKNHYQMLGPPPLPPSTVDSSRRSSVATEEVEEPMGSVEAGYEGESHAPLPKEEESEEIKQVKAKQSGYQYGKIPWNDADVTCIVDDRGTPKFCLNELCSKVLHNHGKGDVFDMVKNLNLPLEHGGGALLKKLQALGLHSNRSPMCKLIACEELWTLLDALREAVPEEVYQHLEHLSTSSTPLLSPHAGGGASAPMPSGLQSPGLVPTGAAALLEEDEHGFESTLHEVECSDGQSVSILRAFNGEQYACVTEFWRKYFPEVNRNHLTSALKRLCLDTIMPTGQQATLLRSAGVISLRGAAGRLMKFGDMEKLMDDFGIPLQIGDDLNKAPGGFSKPSLAVPSTMASSSGTNVPPHTVRRRPTMRGYKASHYSTAERRQPVLPPGMIMMSEEDATYASCMRNMLDSVDVDDLKALLQKSRDEALRVTTGMDTATAGVKSEIDSIRQLIHTRRRLCSALSDDISYLTMTNHGYMAESVRMDHTQKQVLKDVQALLNTFEITLNAQ